MRNYKIAVLLVLVFVLVACAAPQTKTQKGGVYGAGGGAAAGAIIGQAIGGDTDLLVQRGVNISCIQTIGFGERMPLATNDTESGRQLNRSVEIKIALQAQ